MRIMNYIETHAKNSPTAPVILAPQRQVLTYQRLLQFVQEITDYLKKMGFGNDERIAAALLNGSEMACSFFAISNIATFVPLNPEYSEEQFKYYFKLLKIHAVIIQESETVAAKNAASDLGITIFSLTHQYTEAAGLFTLKCDKPFIKSDNSPNRLKENQDICLMLCTSGTTSQPKIVPLTHINLCSSAENRIQAFHLTSADRHLSILPGYSAVNMNVMLTCVAAGGSFICTDGFEPVGFFQILQEMSPTWFSAAPLILQSIIEYVEKNDLQFHDHSLRFIRSTGAYLSEELTKHLERIFRVPVVITYGLTETGNIACNYLAPNGFKKDSVGIVINSEIGIMDENGEMLPTASSGEIVIRGASVFQSYENDPAVNNEAFYKGWFKTGDQGYLDQDGYLFITGRIKEQINKGGEKVSPYEVEKVISQHPDVLDVAVFGFPNSKFGEEVASIVVLKTNKDFTIKQLRRFLKGKIPLIKMPTRLYLADKIPMGPTGKIQRNTLYQVLENSDSTKLSTMDLTEEFIAPRNETEIKLASIWEKILNIKPISVKDDFFELGGDSLLLIGLFTEIDRIWDLKIPLSIIYQKGTIEQIALFINQGEKKKSLCPFLVPLRTIGNKSPLFCFHALDGFASTYCNLSEYLGDDQPVYGIQFNTKIPRKDYPTNISCLVTQYLQDIRFIQPEGPYFLAGFSLGGKIAFEAAVQLKRMGQDVAMLAMFDTHLYPEYKSTLLKIAYQAIIIIKRILKKFSNQINPNNPKKKRKSRIKILFLALIFKATPYFLKSFFIGFLKTKTFLSILSKSFILQHYHGEILYFMPEKNSPSIISFNEWSKLVDDIKVFKMGAHHMTLMGDPITVDKVAKELNRYIAEVTMHPSKKPNK